MRFRRFNLDRLAARFDRWLGPAAVAVKAGPGDAKNEFDPIAIVASLGEIERERDPSSSHEPADELPPLNLHRAGIDQLRRRDDK